MQSEAFREKIFERGQRASRRISEKRSQQMPPMDSINEERQINLPKSSSYISPLTQKAEKINDKIGIARLTRRSSSQKKKPSFKNSNMSTINENNPSTAEDDAELARISQARGI